MRKKRITKTLRFLTIIYLFSLLLIFGLYFLEYVSADGVYTISLAIGLNFFNIFIALASFEFAAGKSTKNFIVFNLGGMVVRLFFLVILLFVVIKFLKIDLYEFILVFFVFYFIQLVVEITHFAKYKELVRDNGS